MNCSVWSLYRSASSLLYLALVSIAVPDGRNACTAEPSNPPAAKPAGLVMNTGFEEGGEQPGWWARHPREESDASRHVRDTSVAHSGSASGLLCSTAKRPAGQAPLQYSRYGISIRGGSALSVSFHVRSEGVAPAGAGCHFYGEGRKHLGFVSIPAPQSADDWTLVQQSVRVPTAARTMGFVLYAKDLGKTWYDDVTVIVDERATARLSAARKRFEIPESGNGGFRLVVAHSLQKIPRTEPVTDGSLHDDVKLEAAGDETEAFQLVVIPNGRALEGVTVEPGSLDGPGGRLQMSWNRVGYVKTAPPSYPVPYVGWWPDPLLPPKPFDVAADHRQPVWISVDVPADAPPGVYTGKVTVRHADVVKSVPVELRVHNFRLPRPGTLATAFGLYAQVLADGYAAKGSYRDTMPVETYARWCRFLAERRLTPKNVAREYVNITKGDDGWEVDLSQLERTVGNLASDYYAPYSFCLERLPVAANLWKGDPEPDTSKWAEKTAAIAAEWKRAGLPPQVYIYGPDEPRTTDYPFLQTAYRQLRQAVPGFPIMQTIGDPNPADLVGLVDIWCPLISRVDTEFYAGRLGAGDTLWTYVCCSPKPPYANFFIDQPATDHRVLFWQARKVGATGVLYWCVCWWPGLPTPAAGGPSFPEEPVDMAQSGSYKSFKANGDGLLVYPGPDWTPYSSIRLETVRDGIEDYEYLALLSNMVEKAKKLPADGRPPEGLISQAEELCEVPDSISQTMTQFTKDADRLMERRGQVAGMIDRMVEFVEK